LERYLELIAALKVRTSNGKGRHLSTGEAIRLLESYGVDTPEGRIQAPKRLLKTPTVNAYLKAWGLDWRTLRREPPAVRFQAQYSNQCFGQNSGSRLDDGAIVTKLFVIGAGFFQAVPLG
jgi:hypothetical protein